MYVYQINMWFIGKTSVLVGFDEFDTSHVGTVITGKGEDSFSKVVEQFQVLV